VRSNAAASRLWSSAQAFHLEFFGPAHAHVREQRRVQVFQRLGVLSLTCEPAGEAEQPRDGLRFELEMERIEPRAFLGPHGRVAFLLKNGVEIGERLLLLRQTGRNGFHVLPRGLAPRR
jgi:hypothetical protein